MFAWRMSIMVRPPPSAYFSWLPEKISINLMTLRLWTSFSCPFVPFWENVTIFSLTSRTNFKAPPRSFLPNEVFHFPNFLFWELFGCANIFIVFRVGAPQNGVVTLFSGKNACLSTWIRRLFGWPVFLSVIIASAATLPILRCSCNTRPALLRRSPPSATKWPAGPATPLRPPVVWRPSVRKFRNENASTAFSTLETTYRVNLVDFHSFDEFFRFLNIWTVWLQVDSDRRLQFQF